MIAIVSSIAALLDQCIAGAMRAVHVSALCAPVSNRPGCNRNATRSMSRHSRTRWMCSALLSVILSFAGTPAARAQDPGASPGPEPRKGHRVAACVTFMGGAAAGLAAHEAGHLIFDAAFGADPGLKRVSFGGIPFFAITHSSVSAREEYVISSAGFWVQHATSEWLLTRHPHLRGEHAPFRKGLLAWNVLASVAYSGAAFARVGPPERDTRGMAVSLDAPEPWMGALI